MRIRKWETVASDPVYRTPIFDLHRRRSSHPLRGERDFFILDTPAWVNIIPLTPRREVVLVRQFRHGVSGFTLEIPGGMIDPGDESPLVAARREMLEECGYDSNDVIELGRVHPNPAIQPNYCYTFLGRDARKVRRAARTATEETQVTVVPLAKVKELIASGRITHALVIAAFSFLHVYNPPRR